MLRTLLEIVIEASEVQPLKAERPMLVTLLGSVIEVSDLQPPKAEFAIHDTPLNMSAVMFGFKFDVYPKRNL